MSVITFCIQNALNYSWHTGPAGVDWGSPSHLYQLDFCSNAVQIRCSVSFNTATVLGLCWSFQHFPKHNDNPMDCGRANLAAIHGRWWSRCNLISASFETVKSGVLVKKMDPQFLSFNINSQNLVYKMCICITYYWAKFGSKRLSIGQGIVMSFRSYFLTHPVHCL